MRHKYMPIQTQYEKVVGLPRWVPMSLIEHCNEQAKINHGLQDLDKLADRAGISPEELWHIYYSKRWDMNNRPTKEEYLKLLLDIGVDRLVDYKEK